MQHYNTTHTSGMHQVAMIIDVILQGIKISVALYEMER